MKVDDQVQQAPDFSDDEWNSVAEERTTGVAPAAEPPQEDSQNVVVQEAQPEQAAQSTEAEKEDDPYAGLSPAVREKLQKLDQLAEMVPKLNTTLKETAGRVGSLQSQLAKQQQELASQPTPAEVEQAAKGKKSWQAIKEEYPDWADGIESLVNERAKPGVDREQLEQQIAQQYREQLAAETAKLSKSIVRRAYPTWEQDVATPDFRSWMSAQPETTQALASSTDPEDAIALLSNFYSSRKPTPQDKQRKLEAAAETRVPARQSAAPVAPVDDDATSAEDIWAQEAKKRLSRRAA